MSSAISKMVRKIGRSAVKKNLKLALKWYNRAKKTRNPAKRALYFRRATTYGYRMAQIKAARARLFTTARARMGMATKRVGRTVSPVRWGGWGR